MLEQICAGRLPSLEYLELWLGVENYGGTIGLADLEPLLNGNLFPNLVSPGLCDSEITDDIALAVTRSPLLKRLKRLDLSWGVLTDQGGRALLASDDVNRLEALGLRYNFLSEDMAKRLAALDPDVDVSDRQDDLDEDDRFPAVTE